MRPQHPPARAARAGPRHARRRRLRGGGSDKAGGERTAKPTVLTMANGNGDSASSSRSPPRWRGSPAGRCASSSRTMAHGHADFESGVIGDVKAGKAELGWAGTRAFDDVGVAAFDALHAPLLIDSYALDRRRSRARSPARCSRAGAGSASSASASCPARCASRSASPGSCGRRTTAARRSRSSARRSASRRCGRSAPARARSSPRRDRRATTASSSRSRRSPATRYDRTASILTANVNLWPGPRRVREPEGARALTRSRAPPAPCRTRGAPGDAVAASSRRARAPRNLCRRGVTFLTASEADLAALRRAVQPVYDRLERDAQTKAAIARIRSLRAEGRSGAAPRRAGVRRGAARRGGSRPAARPAHAARRRLPGDDDRKDDRARPDRRTCLGELRAAGEYVFDRGRCATRSPAKARAGGRRRRTPSRAHVWPSRSPASAARRPTARQRRPGSSSRSAGACTATSSRSSRSRARSRRTHFSPSRGAGSAMRPDSPSGSRRPGGSPRRAGCRR